MDTKRVIQILEALASGCSPITGEILENDTVLNDRDVIRALQIAIEQLKLHSKAMTSIVEIEQSDVKAAIGLFIDQNRNPTPNNLTGFFLGTRQFKNQALISNMLFGKYRDVYTIGELTDFFANYLSDNSIPAKHSNRQASYKQIDFFQKEKFNKLSQSAIDQLKGKINELGILKTENLEEHILEARKTHKRAYEHWSEKELQLLSKAIIYTNDLNLLSECFLRAKGSIESVGQKLIFKAQNTDANI